MQEYPGQKRQRGAAAARIAFVVLWVLLAEWAFPLMFGRRAWAFGMLIIVILAFGFLCHRALNETAREIGLRLDNFYHAARLLVLPMFIFMAVLALIRYGVGSPAMPVSAANRYDTWNFLWLVWWGLLQQYALQAIVNRQAQVIWGNGALSACVVALIFAGLHVPNLPLVLATFAAGLVWASVYQRAPNLPALALSHGIMTVAVVWALPPWLLHGLRVGVGYYRLNPPGGIH